MLIALFFFILGMFSIRGFSENHHKVSKGGQSAKDFRIFNSFVSRSDSNCAVRRRGSWSLYSYLSDSYEKSIKSIGVPEISPKAVSILLTTTAAVLFSSRKRSFAETNPNDINLNSTEPTVTDVCWLDIRVGGGDIKRIEIALYGAWYIIKLHKLKYLETLNQFCT